MEVKESEWVTKAIDNVDRYLNRGGELQGDVPQLLGGTNLLNTIGVAMGFTVRDPRDWTDDELQRALNNNLVYFDGDARKAIDVIADCIRYCCSGDSENFVTVLPIELYFNGKLYELPLFRVSRYKTSKKYYVDNIGRYYSDVDDWLSNSKLPPCKMAYPYNLQLMLRPGFKYSRVLLADTPSAGVGSQVAKGVDFTAAVAGIGSSVGLLCVSGGLAAPLVATGVVSAIWGTGRTGYRLIDKASHGENINPFNDTESRMLWLGIAANLVSFGAMGASMRLTSLAVRGRDISASFKLVVNIMNGTNIVVSGVAMIDTTIFLIQHFDELSTVDVLMHIASVAFWTKGLFTYRTAGTLIKNAQDQTFNFISNELSPDDAANLSSARQQFNNDAQLLREFHRASEANISIQTFSQIVIDANLQGQIQFDGAGNIVLTGGQTYSFEFLSRLPQNVRRHYFDVITNLRPDQIDLMESFRQRVNNDMRLITGLHRVAVRYNLSPREATDQVLNFWSRYTNMNMPQGADVSIRDGALVLGRAPPLPLPQLQGLTDTMMRFVGEQLVRLDESTSRSWATSVPLLLQLETQGMFTACRAIRVIPAGRAVLLLNENLQISIYRLREINADDCRRLLILIGELPTTATRISGDLQTLISRYRLRLEFQRRETLNWMNSNTNSRLLPIVNGNLQKFEVDRLFTFKNTIDKAKATPYVERMMNFIADMRPRNVSEMVAYGEFVVDHIEADKRSLEGSIRDGTLQLPRNTNKAAYLRRIASDAVFSDTRVLVQKWSETAAIVREHSMVGVAQLASGLTNDALIQAIKQTRICFGSETSAIYHVLKHPTSPLSAYVNRANEAIRSATSFDVNLAQDGDARFISFLSESGTGSILEREGRVLLATFTPKTS